MNKALKKSILTYLIFLLICIAGIFWSKYLVDTYPFLRTWGWVSVVILLIGIPFLFLQKQAGIPEFWTKEISNRNRIWIPALIGIGFGILDVIIIKGILHPEPYTELPPFLQPFPYSLFLYFSGAFEVEVFYRLIPIVLVLFIFSKIEKGKYQTQAFWIIAVLTAIREPLEQMPSGETWFIAYALISGFGMNFIQAVYFKKSGFIANLSLRLGHYLVWHILLGLYVQMVGLG
ncbi:hypothetical protein [Algoriphagus sp. A40]|uniref:hypothetical protein n=1 Tax=Algoriphagus sp. A40 TaxID=1945863 RepID=UPI0009864417|nr:hypothetical protein [Algoriphagus sp. A40]OOG72814.1 hypothetical protein B0E43_15255 [Algoriphagus sp. A40]